MESLKKTDSFPIVTMPKLLNAICCKVGFAFSIVLTTLLPFVDGGFVRSLATAGSEEDTVRKNAPAVGTLDDTHVRLPNERRRRNQQQDVFDYEIWKAPRFPQVLEDWAEKYSDFIRVTTSQEAYGLGTAGDASDCPFYEGKGCPNYFFTLQDYISHPVDSVSSNNLPEVFWSGCLHGNERIGPTSVMEASHLLLQAAYCESLPRRTTTSSRGSDLQEAKACRKDLRNKGIDDVHRKWLARLVSTRRIVVVPTTNALGYFRNRREEGKIDPNRDFPYDLKNPTLCMQTMAGRTVNEIYREHMFQLALTFHAGMEVVAYEWGAPSYLNHFSPDHNAQEDIGGAYSLYGGNWSRTQSYNYGTMNDEVYFVRGGMEDWAYAGSWTPQKVPQCTPRTFGGYPIEKTTYNNSTLRVFNMLVETSDDKEPKQHLGNSMEVLNKDTDGNGHISRNIRLALLSADMVEPYVGILGVNNLVLTDDIVPTMQREATSCVDTKAVMVARNAEKVDVEWTVGGALSIDSTELWYAKWDDLSGEIECWTQPDNTDGLVSVGGTMSGTGFFSNQGSRPRPEESATGIKMTNGPLFHASILLKKFKKGDKILVIASARVDKAWKDQPDDVLPKVPPQSHIVNARTDPSYLHESNGKRIQGRLDWFSMPLTIVIGDFEDSVGIRGNDFVNIVEMHPRLGESSNNKGGVKPKSAQNDQLWFPLGIFKFLVVILLIVTVTMCCIRFFYRPSHGRQKLKLGDSLDISDEDPFEDEPLDDNKYSDRTDDEYGDDDEDDDGIEIPTIS